MGFLELLAERKYCMLFFSFTQFCLMCIVFHAVVVVEDTMMNKTYLNLLLSGQDSKRGLEATLTGVPIEFLIMNEQMSYFK